MPIHRPTRDGSSRLLVVLIAAVVLGTVLPAPIAAPVLGRDPSVAACQPNLGDTGLLDPDCADLEPAEPVATALPAGFTETVALSGLVVPTAVEFAADGRVFVAEKSGVLKVFDSLTDPTPSSFSGLTTNVLDLWDRGLLGMTIDPSLKDPGLPLRPWVYVLYTYDHVLGSAAPAPRWGDGCPTPPGPTTDGCVASARLSRLTVSGSTISGPEQVLVEDWCQQFTSHSIGALQFGADGALYVSGGDGADFNREDWGQWGGTLGSPPPVPKNPCGDPPGDAMTPPTAEGGALRAQDLRTESQAGASYLDTVLADAPLAWWRLGETSGTLADDAVGSANGTYTGGFTLNQPGALTGDANPAVLLNGTTGYVRVPQQTLPGNITLEAWARPTTYPGDTALVGQWNGTSGAMLYVTSDAGGRVHLWINGASISATAPAAGAWHHYVGTYDGTNARIYIDGGLAAGPTPLAGPLTTAPRFLEMGTYNNGGGGKFNGVIDEVALYPTALSASRVQAHFAAGRQALDPTSLDGTILRLDPVTGAAFAGNPFASSADLNKRRIIAYGLRNPFRFALRPGTTELWLGDVGWQVWEEINRIANTGDATVENFGWPCYEGAGKQPGYDSSNLTICEGLYAEGPAAVTSPVYAYNHAAAVVSGDGCATGNGSAISGMAFYPETGGTFPAEYRGGLFFGDHSRNCIWWMAKGANGQPDPATRAAFVAPAAHPVDIEIGPDGALYYVNLDDGEIRRVAFASGNQPPTAVAGANPTSGPLPLTVNFSGTASSDPEAGPLTFAWDLDGDGAFDDSTSPTPSWTYQTQATVTVGLRVTDQGALSDTDTVVISAG
ncbi:MAG TPA: LamG-like jellyroll fold domain-containing protein, partial [Candidatus Limnocylindrales bacterium]|nr:LamG-like jellyroll fold domain-containing protein [Candidatus Limnocylindrales bacterium]